MTQSRAPSPVAAAVATRRARALLYLLLGASIAAGFPVTATHGGPHVVASFAQCVVEGQQGCEEFANAPPGASGYWTGPVDVSLACAPAEPGCTITYEVDGEPFGTYEGPFSIVFDGVTTIVATATTEAFPEAPADTFVVKIDSFPPDATLGMECIQSGLNGWCVDTIQMFPGLVEDGGSPVELTCVDHATVVTCDGWTITTDGARKVYANATDEAGHSDSASQDVRRDATGPVAPALDCPTFGNGGWCIDFPVLTNASDATSGVALTSCVLNDFTIPCDPQTFDDEGDYFFSGYAEDNAGNSGSDSASFSVDTLPPMVSIETSCDEPGLNGWCLGLVSYWMNASDDGSGLAQPQIQTETPTVQSAGVTCTRDGEPADCEGVVGSAGVSDLRIVAEDGAGHTADASASVSVDLEAPVAAVDTACEGSGNEPWCIGLFSLSASAADDADGSPALVCWIDDGSPESCETVTASPPQGEHTFHARATDDAGRTHETSVDYALDTEPPTIDPVADMTVAATSGEGAIVSYGPPATHDDVAGDGLATCAPATNSTFPLGTTEVRCTASDPAGNDATDETFNVTVVDSTAPVIDAHEDVTAEATSAAGAVVAYVAPGWTDQSGESGVASCLPLSNATFALGNTTVECSATDSASNTATSSFTVRVVDTTAPGIAAHDDEIHEATAPAGAVVFYVQPTTTDAVDGAGTATCSPVPNSSLTLGTHLVTCDASDAAGNDAMSTTFNLTVVDTTAPSIEPSADLVAEATGPSGAHVSYSAPATTDAVDGDGVATCAPASGDVFPLGTTTVECVAEDEAGNNATSTFDVTVEDTTAPAVSIVPTCNAEGIPGWCLVSYAYNMSATDVGSGLEEGSPDCFLDNVSIACVGTVSAQGPHTLRIEARDAAGNENATTLDLALDSIAPTTLSTRRIAVGQDDGETRATFFFSEPMSRVATEAAIEAPVGWVASWDESDRWLNVTPLLPIEGQSVAVNVTTAATDAHGKPLAFEQTRNVLVRGPRDYLVASAPYGFVNITTNGTDTGMYCDDVCDDAGQSVCPGLEICGTNVQMPFGFTYFGHTYYELNVSPNGFVTLGRSDCIGDYTPDPFPGTCPNLIAAYWEDLDTRLGSPNSSTDQPRILTHTIGEAPHRAFIVSWSAVHHYHTTLPLATFQLQLHEGTNAIEMHYENATSDAGDHLIGVINANGTRHTTYAFLPIDMRETALRFSGDGTVGDSIAPTVNVTGSLGVLAGPNATVTYTFSEPMDTDDTLDALEGAEGWSALWSEDATVLTISNENVSEGVTTLRLTTLAADQNGVRLAAENVRVIVRDTTPPTVNVTGDQGLLPGANATIVYTFSEPMDTTATLAALENATGWSANWSEDGTVLTLTNAAVAVGVTTLTLTTDATDAHGVPLEAPVARSVERAAPPTPPPTTPETPAPPPPADPTPPDAPLALVATVNGTTARLAWSPPAQDHGATVTHYLVSVDGGAPAEVGGRAFDAVGLSRGASHTFSVRAVNSAGAGPAAVTSATVPPASTLDAPAEPEGGWYGSLPTVTLTAEPSSATILYDLGEGEQTYTGPFAIPAGERTLRWHATLGGIDEPEQERDFRVDVTPPVISGASASGDDPTQIGAVVADPGSGVARVEALVGSARVVLSLGDDSAFHGAIDLLPGVHEIVVVAVDHAGHETRRSFTHEVLDVSPEIPEPPPPTPTGGSTPLEGTSNPPGGGTQGGEQPTPTPSTGPTPTPTTPEPQSEPEPTIVIELPDGGSLGSGVRGTITIRLDNVPDLETVRVVLIDADGNETELSAGQLVTEWDTTTVPDGYYTIQVRRGAEPLAEGEVTILSSHETTLATADVLVRNPEPVIEVAGKVAGTVAIAAGAQLTLSAMGSGAASSASAGFGGGGFDAFGFAQEVAIDAGQDKLKSKTLERDRRRRRVRSLIAAIGSLAILAVLWSFAETEGWSWTQWLAALPVVGLAAVMIMAMKYSSEAALATATAARPRVRVWIAGTISLAVSAIVLRNPFGYPAYVDEEDESEARSTWGMQAKRALATIAGACAFMVPFLILAPFVPWQFVSIGMLLAVTNVATAAMPFGPLPGKDVWRWNKLLAVLVAVGGLALYVAFAAAYAPLWAFWAIGVAGGVAYTVALVRFRRTLVRGKTVRVPVEVPVPVRTPEDAPTDAPSEENDARRNA